jgi:TM2 domain-containing membrane protein YozV
MNCYNHPENEAVGTCTSCGKPICNSCLVEMQGKLICRNCLASGKTIPSSMAAKDVNTAFLLELIGGFLGLLGIGYLYSGRTNDGVIRLILWIIYDVIAGVTISLLLTVFVGFCCIPVQLVIQIGVPLWSANELKKEMDGRNPVQNN